MPDPEHPKRLVDTAADIVAPQSEVLASERNLGRGIKVEELAARILKHRADPTAQLVGGPVGKRRARYAHPALEHSAVSSGDKPVHQSRHRCFPAARRSRKHDALPPGNPKRHAVESANPRIRSIREADVFYIDGEFGSPCRLLWRAHATTPVFARATEAAIAQNRSKNTASMPEKRKS